jgi:uncharacterized protein YggE
MEYRILPTWIAQVLGVLIMILLILLILNQWNTFKGSSQIMSVSASGHVTAVPDVATVTVGVVSRGGTSDDVKNQNNKKMNQVIDFVKAQGVDPKNITTTSLNISPLFNYENNKNNITSYQAEQSITVKLEKFDKTILEKIVNGVVDQGANQVQGVNFSFSDTDKWKSLARKNAIENAQNKANQIASDAHLHLGKLINVSESKYEAPMPVVYGANVSLQAKSVAPTIEPGSQDIDETLTLLYEVN